MSISTVMPKKKDEMYKQSRDRVEYLVSLRELIHRSSDHLSLFHGSWALGRNGWSRLTTGAELKRAVSWIQPHVTRQEEIQDTVGGNEAEIVP